MHLFRKVLPYRGPWLRVGVSIGGWARYTRHDLRILSAKDFEAVRAPSLIWGMTRDDDTPSTDPDEALFGWLGTNIESLHKTKYKKRTLAVIDPKGHKYTTFMLAGKLSQRAVRLRYADEDTHVVEEMVACFAPSKRREPWYLDLPLERTIEGHLEPRALTQAEATPERLKSIESRVALGSNIIE